LYEITAQEGGGEATTLEYHAARQLLGLELGLRREQL